MSEQPVQVKKSGRKSYTLRWAGSAEAVKRGLNCADLVEEWELPPGGLLSQLWAGRGCFWLSCPEFGAIRFRSSSRAISVYPAPGVETGEFEGFLLHEWLPLVYTAWGCQVLHASAALHLPTQRVVAFCGTTGSGKSTLGYGLGRRRPWQQIADDSLALSVEPGRVRLLPLPNTVRLRQASAQHYARQPFGSDELDWPNPELCLDTIFFPQMSAPGEGDDHFPTCIPLNGAQVYPLLLSEAFAFTLTIPEYNKRLMQNYLSIARHVKAYRLQFARSFSILEETLDVVEHWA